MRRIVEEGWEEGGRKGEVNSAGYFSVVFRVVVWRILCVERMCSGMVGVWS